MTDSISLAWDSASAVITLNGVTITVAPASHIASNVDAIVIEQDTSLVLGDFNGLIPPEMKPAWFFAHKLASQPVLSPGQVIVANGTPVQLYAIVHDLDQNPTWNEGWVKSAIENLFPVSSRLALHVIQLPILASKHGNIEPGRFIRLLVSCIRDLEQPVPLRIWLSVALDQYPAVVELLQSLKAGQNIQKGNTAYD